MASHLRERMLRIFPQLEEARITHSWAGFVGMTSDRLPHVAEHDGVFHAVGCNGNGVALMTFLGWHAAQLMLGSTNRRAFFADIPFRAVPLYNGRPWFVPLVSAAYHAKDFVANPREVAAERAGKPAKPYVPPRSQTPKET